MNNSTECNTIALYLKLLKYAIIVDSTYMQFIMKISKKLKMIMVATPRHVWNKKSQFQERQDAENGMSTKKRNIKQVSI